MISTEQDIAKTAGIKSDISYCLESLKVTQSKVVDMLDGQLNHKKAFGGIKPDYLYLQLGACYY